MRVAVILPFMLNGGRVAKAGEEVEVDQHLGRDLINRHRARLVEADTPPAGPMTTQSAAALVTPRAKSPKGKSHV